VTDAGPPDRMTPLGLKSFMLFDETLLKGCISEYTPDSLTRLAINCVTWEPKSMMRIRFVMITDS